MPQYFKTFPDIAEDRQARSRSYNFKSDLSFFTRAMLEELLNIARNEKENARLSLHTDSSNVLHNMIIMQRKGTYNRPHKHALKAEAYHLVYGEQLAVIFDENGSVRDKCRMSTNGTAIYRFEKNLYHMSVPLSDIVVFHESKIGPFVRKGDSLFPDWAPAAADKNGIQSFLKDRSII